MCPEVKAGFHLAEVVELGVPRVGKNPWINASVDK